MMSEVLKHEDLCRILARLNLDLSSEEIAIWAIRTRIDDSGLDLLISFLETIETRRDEKIVQTLKRLSRLPQREPKRFDNFERRELSDKAFKDLNALKSLSFLPSKQNVIMVGPTGTGKTHLAMAIGNECCEKKQKTYFIKMEELKFKFRSALQQGMTGSVLSSLSKYSCLIIDEIGHTKFSKDETELFFQLVDRIDAKQTGSLILTTNKELNDWEPLFEDSDALECALDRIWNNALVLKFTGESYRGKRTTSNTLDFGGGLKLTN